MVQGRTGGMGGPPVLRKQNTPGLVLHRNGGNAEPESAARRAREMTAGRLRKLGRSQNPAYGFHRRRAGRRKGRPAFAFLGLLVGRFDSIGDISKLTIHFVNLFKLFERFIFFAHFF